MQESNPAAITIAESTSDMLGELHDDLQVWLKEGSNLPGRNKSELKFFSSQLFDYAKAMGVAATFAID